MKTSITISELQSQIPDEWRKIMPETLWSMDSWRLWVSKINDDYAELCPKPNEIFKSLKLIPDSNNVKVVLIGQDPYYSKDMSAMGLSFSVRNGNKINISLQNIFKELSVEYGELWKQPLSGDLSQWCKEGVLLLNSVLTTKIGTAHAHQRFGCENITKIIIDSLRKVNPNVIFLSLGSDARKIITDLAIPNDFVIFGRHPSPLSISGSEPPFIGSNIFKKVNIILIEKGILPVRWNCICP